MRLSRYYQYLLLAGCIISPAALLANQSVFSGHIKYNAQHTRYPRDSSYRQLIGRSSNDQNIDIRLNFDKRQGNWAYDFDYQLLLQDGDTLTVRSQFQNPVLGVSPVMTDDNRLFSLTGVVHDEPDQLVLHRIDRMSLSYTGEKVVLRLGRQAISWGNGLLFSPMDIFNPFDPAAIDTEYKTGDDMLYGQYLLANGHDMQAVFVARRDELANYSSRVNSTAAKYHGFVGNGEFDVLLAKHYDEQVLAVGGNTGIGGALWRADIVFTETEQRTVSSYVSSLSYSWGWWEKNFSGFIEYYKNGFGQDDGNYANADLLNNQDLTRRLIRGELYTLGREYLGLSTTAELSPLWMLTSNVIYNLSDRSTLIQLQGQYSMQQNSQLLLVINKPTGSTGSEFGGVATGIANTNLATDFSVFAQLAWYF